MFYEDAVRRYARAEALGEPVSFEVYELGQTISSYLRVRAPDREQFFMEYKQTLEEIRALPVTNEAVAEPAKSQNRTLNIAKKAGTIVVLGAGSGEIMTWALHLVNWNFRLY